MHDLQIKISSKPPRLVVGSDVTVTWYK